MAKKPKFQDPADTDKLWEELVTDLIVPSQLDLSTAAAIQNLINRPEEFAYFEVGGKGLWLTDNTARLYYRMAHAISREAEFAPVASRSYIEKALQPAIHRVVDDDAAGQLGKPRDYLNNVRRELRGEVVDWKIIAPIAGVSLQGVSSLSLGDTRLIARDSDEAKDLIADLEAAANTGEELGQNQRAEWREFHLGPLSERFPFPAVAVTAIKACDGTRALDSGIAIIEQFTASLRAFRWLADRTPLHAAMGLPKEIPIAGAPAIAYSPQARRWATGRAGSPRRGLTFTVDSNTITGLDNLGWQTLSAIWAKEDKASPWEAILRSAAWWLGMAFNDRHTGVASVKFATVLEMLLCQDQEAEGGGITERVAERLAFVLSDDPEPREDVWRKMKDLYAVRSDVVHSGFAHVLEEDLTFIRYFAVECFFTLLNRLDEIHSFEKLREWCLRRRFEAGGPPGGTPQAHGAADDASAATD
jgi:hypothetical protein